MGKIGKKDVELVLVKSFEFFRERFDSDFDFVDLRNLSASILSELHEEREIDEQLSYQYTVSQTQLDRLRVSGKYEFTDVMGNTITLRYEDDSEIPFVLESGKIIVWDEEKYIKDKKNNDKSKTEKKKNKLRTWKRRSIQSSLPLSHKKKINLLDKNNVGLNRSIDSIREVRDIYKKMKRDYLLRSLEKLLSDVMREYSREKRIEDVMNGKQTTVNDYVIL